MSAVTEYDLFFRLRTVFSVIRPMPPNNNWEGPFGHRGPAGQLRVEPFDAAVVERQHPVLDRLDQEQSLEGGQLVGVLRRQVMGLGPVGGGVVQLPHVVVEGRKLGTEQPRDAVPGHGHPTLVVDPTVADHLEVLRLPALGCAGIIEQVGHGDALDRLLLEAVHHRRLGKAGHVEHGGRRRR